MQNESLYLNIFDQIDFDRIIDHPDILIAARFWEEERYQAAKTCYKFMRAIDDFIDNHKTRFATIAEHRREEFASKVNDWLYSVKKKHHHHPLNGELVECVRQFHIPIWPMEDFARAMIYDIHHDGFPTVDAFMDYSQGATVAPSSIFVHLAGLRRSNGSWSEPQFEVRESATPCAIFSYLVHIMRDFQKDQINNLSYFADDRICANGLTRKDLKAMAEGSPITGQFRNLIREYKELAEGYILKTLAVIDRISPLVEPRYQLSLRIIFNLYLMVYERIDPDRGTFTSEELNPTAAEIRGRVYQTIRDFTI